MSIEEILEELERIVKIAFKDCYYDGDYGNGFDAGCWSVGEEVSFLVDKIKRAQNDKDSRTS